jgi:hypothetical protein
LNFSHLSYYFIDGSNPFYIDVEGDFRFSRFMLE